MGRFTVVEEHTILGTEHVVYITRMSAASSFAYRDAVFASMASTASRGSADELKDQLEASLELRPIMLESVMAHTFDDPGATRVTFVSIEAVADELSETQLNDLWAAIASRGGFSGDRAAMASRFPADGEGSPGSVPATPDVIRVRDAAK